MVHKKDISDFIKKNKKNLFNPLFWLKFAYKTRYLHFFVVGVSSLAIHLFIAWLFTNLIFGLDKYFYGYVIGMAVALVYNFLLQTFWTYKTSKGHFKRFNIFIAYSVLISFVQASVVKFITPVFGLQYYLFVIAGAVFFQSIFTFLIFKLWLFKE